MARLQVGCESFREIRENDLCYVDKSSFLEEFLCSLFVKVSLITRPRRFGKTLMMSMLHDFFDIRQDSKSIFEGLAISKNKDLCDKWMNQYPAVFITFKGIEGRTFEDALKKLRILISDICIDYSFLIDSMSVDEDDRKKLAALKAEKSNNRQLADSLKTICSALHDYYGKPAILLIDEYDVPMAKACKYGYYDKMAGFIGGMLDEGLKTNDFLQFGILTGCLKISWESFFTGLNNFKCFGISDVLYADKFGFTSEEVDDLLAANGCTARKPDIKEWYDGYRFGNDKEMYCPWDILKYIGTLQKNPGAKPQAYWQNSSRNDIVRTFVDHCETDDVVSDLNTLMSGGCVETNIVKDLTYDRLYEDTENMWTVLYMTGYLTKASPEQMEKCIKHGEEPEKGQTFLAIPNKEVLEIFADVISKWFKKEVQNIDRSELFKAFWDDDADDLADLLCEQLDDTISYFDARENFYHAFIAALFTFSSWYVHSNKEFGRGRPDIVVRDKQNKRAAVIEVKRASSEKGLPGAAEKAILQIKEQQYTAPFLKRHWKVSLWGMAFFKKTCILRVEECVLNA